MSESEMIARRIYNLEHGNWKELAAWNHSEFEQRKHGKHTIVYISTLGDIEIHISDDWMCWYVWKTFEDQARPFYKVIKANMPEIESMIAMLDAQGWSCI